MRECFTAPWLEQRDHPAKPRLDANSWPIYLPLLSVQGCFPEKLKVLPHENRYFRGVRTCSWNSFYFPSHLLVSFSMFETTNQRMSLYFQKNWTFRFFFLRWSFSNSSTWATRITLKESGRWHGGCCWGPKPSPFLLIGVSGVTMAGSRMICPPKIGWLRTLQSPKRCRKVASYSKS